MIAHSFSVDLATEIGLEEALLLQHFTFWFEQNVSEPDYVKEGLVWCYSSVKSMESIFPYLTSRKIRTAIEHLEELGLLVESDYNINRMMKTKWYALTPSGMEKMGKLDHYERFVKMSNRFVKLTNVNNSNTRDNNKAYIYNKEKEKEKESEACKTTDQIVAEKTAKFREECQKFVPKFNQQMVDEFVNYWTEPNGEKLKWEISKKKVGAFDIQRRLQTWANNNFNRDYDNSLFGNQGTSNNTTASQDVQSIPSEPQRRKKELWEEIGFKSREEYEKDCRDYDARMAEMKQRAMERMQEELKNTNR